jgi:hypothetical protein
MIWSWLGGLNLFCLYHQIGMKILSFMNRDVSLRKVIVVGISDSQETHIGYSILKKLAKSSQMRFYIQVIVLGPAK